MRRSKHNLATTNHYVVQYNYNKETMRSRSISPSTSIRSRYSEDSDSDDSDDTSRYAGLTAQELNAIWERRNLAYFDRRQRLLAEERQQQGLSGRDDDSSVAQHSSSSDSSASVQEQLGAESAPPVQHRGQQRQQLTRPAGFVCAADDPQWRDFTSRNIFGEYDPERASREPAYHNAWISCERLVNMHRSGAAAAGNFIPTNPRLAALLEHRRLEVARERYEEETAMQRQQQFSQGGPAQQHNMMVDGSASSQETTAFDAAAVPAAVQQAAEHQRLNQAHRLQPHSAAHAHYGSNSPKSSSSDSSVGDKSVDPTAKTSYYLALPYPTQQLTKYVLCDECNCALYTSPLAKRFFCQTCGSVSSVPVQGANASFEEKMQDAEDQDCQMSY